MIEGGISRSSSVHTPLERHGEWAHASLGRGLCRSAPIALIMAILLTALVGGAAQAKVVFHHGKAYGEMLTPRAQSHAGARRFSPLTLGGPQSPVKYGGGPLMLSSKLYLIFWGPSGSFPSSYTTPIIQYAKDLQSDESLTTDEFSVAEQYTNGEGAHISGKVTFGGEVFDTTDYPALDKAEGCTKAPCVTDSQIQAEILKQIEANSWQTDPASAPEAQYLLYTPEDVVTCDEPGSCSNSQDGYCAYHSEITGISPGGRVVNYSDLPYEPECNSGQAPAGVGGNANADGTLDSEIHEIVESATDPYEGTGYTDSEDNEVADKCTSPVVESQPDVYGAPLGGSLSELTAFNQLIGGHSYYTQQIWSQAPTQTPASSAPAGCAARIGPTPVFTAPETAQTGQAVDFDGSGSYDISEPISTYAWNYGDGSAIETTSGVKASHVYLEPGTYQVTLTVSDSSGSEDSSTQTIPITITASAIGPPSAVIESPSTGQSYTVGQTVPTRFACAEAPGGPGIKSCTDSNASTSPGALRTAAVGEQSYTVTALSIDGQSATTTIHYAVTATQSSNPGTGGSSGGGSSSSSGTSGTGSSGSGSVGGSPTAPGTEPAIVKTAVLTRAQKLALALRRVRSSRRASARAASGRPRSASRRPRANPRKPSPRPRSRTSECKTSS